jgi:D-aspartate ligase
VRKLRQHPTGYGSMCYGQTEKNEALAAEGRKLILALGYRGLGSLEFKYRQRDGGYYFIEMNTRLPWYNGLFADAGVNLPYLAYLDLADQSAELKSFSPSQQRDGTTWVGYHNYAACFREIKHQRSLSRMTFLSHIVRAKSYGWWNSADPNPFFASGVLAARRAAGSVLRKIGLR